MLSTYLLRLAEFEVWTVARRPTTDDRAGLVAAAGARYVSATETPLPALRDETGGFDIVVEATGDAQVMIDSLGLLRRNGVACLLGLDSRRAIVELEARVIGVDAILENRVLFGSVNAHRRTGSRRSMASFARGRTGRTRLRPSSTCASRASASRRRSPTGA